MESKERRTVNDRRISDRRKRIDPNYKGQERRNITNRRIQEGRRKRD